MFLNVHTAGQKLEEWQPKKSLQLKLCRWIEGQTVIYTHANILLLSLTVCRGNQLGVTGWGAMARALEHVTSLTSLNRCGQYVAIRTGGLAEIELGGTELGMWVAPFLERSAATLTALHLRCAGLPRVSVRHFYHSEA